MHTFLENLESLNFKSQIACWGAECRQLLLKIAVRLYIVALGLLQTKCSIFLRLRYAQVSLEPLQLLGLYG
jgi:hypothetical protein